MSEKQHLLRRVIHKNQPFIEKYNRLPHPKSEASEKYCNIVLIIESAWTIQV